jgi:hypothetical protein
MGGISSNQIENEEEDMHFELEKEEKPSSNKNQNKITLEKKLQLKMDKMESMDVQITPKENVMDINKNSISKITGQNKLKKKSIKDKFKEKMLKNKLKLKQTAQNNLNKKFYGLPPPPVDNQFNQVPLGAQVNPNLYGATYSGQRCNVGFNQFQSHFNYSGIYMNPVNPINQFPRQEGK